MVVSAAKALKIDCIGKDLGNGWDKETANGQDVFVEPAVFAEPADEDFQINENDDLLVSVNKGKPIYIGQDALDSGFPIKSALGESDTRRYESVEYRNLLFGSIGKHYMANLEINMLVLGLPNKHFKNKEIREKLKNSVVGKQIVQVGQTEMLIDVKNSFVMPQPVGTIAYLQAEGEEFPGQVLVVDGGYGTLDLSVVRGTSVIDYQQKELGMKQAYKQIKTILETKLEQELNINEIPHVLKNGIQYGRETLNPLKFPEVEKVMKDHFEELYQFIIDCYSNPKRFSAIIWTGGVAPAHKERILAKDERTGAHNARVLENGQVANCIGFYEFGMGLLGDE